MKLSSKLSLAICAVFILAPAELSQASDNIGRIAPRVVNPGVNPGTANTGVNPGTMNPGINPGGLQPERVADPATRTRRFPGRAVPLRTPTYDRRDNNSSSDMDRNISPYNSPINEGINTSPVPPDLDKPSTVYPPSQIGL